MSCPEASIYYLYRTKGTVITGNPLTAAMIDGLIRSLRILVAEELVFIQTQLYLTGYLQVDSHVPRDPSEYYPSSFVITLRRATLKML